MALCKTTFNIRIILLPLYCGALLAAIAPGALAAPFAFSQVVHDAHNLARSPWRPRPVKASKSLRQLSPQAYGHILDSHPLWKHAGLPFEVLFYPLGGTFDHPVRVNMIRNGQAYPIRYDPKNFSAEGRLVQKVHIPQNGGYAGFSLLYPLDTPPHHNEFLSFLGASYFRVVGKGAVYGTSARGLGIDTALPSGEIFPYFREFWLQRPTPGVHHLTIYALLDSPLVTGAYRFEISPGESTHIRVQAVLYPRKKIRELEIAPLSSMFWHGRGRGIRAGDWHPQQHDSSDLVMANGDGEWITRPLNNPLFTQVTRYTLDHPQGFGLFQQDRRFSSYEGLSTQYQMRPSVWIQPLNNWGKGQVELVELPTNNRNLDNIVTFWVPRHPPRPGRAFSVRYRLDFFLDAADMPPGGHPVATYLGTVPHSGGSRRIVVDFAGGGLGRLPASLPVQAHLSVGPGARLIHSAVHFDPLNHQWQMQAEILPPAHHPTNVRLFLESRGHVLSDTWTYLLQRGKES
ncbi:MAG TPA: glucan biosynthesis protein [Acidithiobacillus sp.]|nr:glucan biosynthesis protein [Acidithiobacillus sp.]